MYNYVYIDVFITQISKNFCSVPLICKHNTLTQRNPQKTPSIIR